MYVAKETSITVQGVRWSDLMVVMIRTNDSTTHGQQQQQLLYSSSLL